MFVGLNKSVEPHGLEETEATKNPLFRAGFLYLHSPAGEEGSLFGDLAPAVRFRKHLPQIGDIGFGLLR